MSGYSPLKITGYTSGLIEQREEFLLPNDAYPTLKNAYCWREKLLRKRGTQLLGRLRRNFTNIFIFPTTSNVYDTNLLKITGTIIAANNANPGQVTTSSPHNLQTGDQVIISNVVGATGYNGKVFTITVIDDYNFTIGTSAAAFGAYVSGGFFFSNRSVFQVEPYAVLVPTSITIVIQSVPTKTYQDDGISQMFVGASRQGSINYYTGDLHLTSVGSPRNVLATFSYYPGLPVMGIRTRELQNSLNDQTIFFDQRYAYVYDGSLNRFTEYLPGTEWNKHNADTSGVDFFWSTNYWVSQLPQFTTNNVKLMWVTNNTGQFGTNADPIRITDGSTWINFQPPNYGQIDETNFVVNCLSMLPFRGRLLMFNTWEGPDFGNALNYSNRIRWSTIGNPFIPFADGPPATGSWRDDIRGQGGFLDIPTSEDIVAVGFVRDNLVIYCEKSTWQLRYTGRAIAPFQIERVNSEIGADSALSLVQFDTSTLTIGDKGIVECDSYKSARIDIKIVDFVFRISAENNGPTRIQGIRDYINKIAYWTIPLSGEYDPFIDSVFPNQRLLYNYENNSWALFDDSFTAFGTFQFTSDRTWLNTTIPWLECEFAWIDQTNAEAIESVAGNQVGYISLLDKTNVNDFSLFVTHFTLGTIYGAAILGIVIPNHNLRSGQIIYSPRLKDVITNFPGNNYYKVAVVDSNTISVYRSVGTEFEDNLYPWNTIFPPVDPYEEVPVAVLDNFNIKSKKFNFLDYGNNIQIGYFDTLTLNNGADGQPCFTFNIYQNYSDVSPVFTGEVPMYTTNINTDVGDKIWSRSYCQTRASFFTLEYTFDDFQILSGFAFMPIQIDAQILWIRKSGRMTEI